jgi:hypothetical protein
VVLWLSPENRRIVGGEFVVRGELEARDLKLEASKLWPDAEDNLWMAVKIPKGDVFSFSEGGLWSDVVDGDDLETTFYTVEEGRQTSPVAAEEAGEMGAGSFSVRMVCQISKQSSQARGVYMKYHILVFPRSKEGVLQEGAHAKLGSFPGIKLCEGEFPLGPPPAKAWQCPVVPFTIPGTPYEELAIAPAADRLRAAIAGVMAKATAPEICKNASTLAAKWDKLKRSPGEIGIKTPQISWPRPKCSNEGQGKK